MPDEPQDQQLPPEQVGELFDRYVDRLRRLAASQMGKALARRVDEEDIVQSVFRTFFRRTSDGEYSNEDTLSLWRLLAQITVNKTRAAGVHHRRLKRDVSSEIDVDPDSFSRDWSSREPSPEEAVTLTDYLQATLARLTESEASILGRSLQGQSTPEIASEFRVSRWTVNRVLNRVIGNLQDRVQGDFEGDNPEFG